MDADNHDRPHYHLDGGYDDDYNWQPNQFIDVHAVCTDDNCGIGSEHYVVVPLDEYRALVAAARDRHPAGQQRGPDPATRADNCICWGYGDDHHAACPACTP